jgi:hypothetical protein
LVLRSVFVEEKNKKTWWEPNFFLLKPTFGNYSYLSNAPTDTTISMLFYIMKIRLDPTKVESSYKRA